MRGDTLGRRRLLGGGLGLALLALVSWQGVRAEPSADAARTLIETVGHEVLDVLRDASLSDRQKFDQLVAPAERADRPRSGRPADPRPPLAHRERGAARPSISSCSVPSPSTRWHPGWTSTAARISRSPAPRWSAGRMPLVSTRILSEGPPLAVDWRVRERDDKSLVAIDVIVAGVSLIVTQRSEFGAVIERHGIDGLLAELRRRAEIRA